MLCISHFNKTNSNGSPNKVHLSETTANLLRAAGKESWLVRREDKVSAKGKGILQTYWLIRNHQRASSAHSEEETNRNIGDSKALKSRKERLVEWICDVIEEPLELVLINNRNRRKPDSSNKMIYKRQEGKTFLDETEEVITLAEFDAKTSENKSNDDMALSDAVRLQLRQYVTVIASLYNNNPFHNFEHACHVTMAVSKVLKRIISPDLDFDKIKGSSLEAHLHDYTYGITSDPLAVLAIIFSALIHDVDHQGISNMQLMKEQPSLAATFRMQSVAEQNSLELAWDVLMEDDYNDLRAAMFCTNNDLMRFRQVLINVVLATDIFDKGLNDARKNRWQKAFHNENVQQQELYSLRATIVIEHIIQASDVAHTMQHWHVYQKWNKRLFLEMTAAYRDGRMGADPASFWYQGELGFFDNYIIPLAKKLKECGVFGVSSDEFLNYAEQNRSEWAERGQEIVADLINDVSMEQKIDDNSYHSV
jgi:3'5'-cyclic nucleotide phosphodiesterase/Adenylate and Guanylate cyclase catalytic domain